MLNVAGGDLPQLGILFEKYHVPLYNYFFRLNYDKDLAEDLTQNVFERIIKYKATYTESFPFRAWMYRIARNVNTDHFRYKKIKKDENIEVADIQLTTENVLDCIEKREKRERLEQALMILKKEDREILILSRFEEMKYAEISELLGISEASVKVKVHRSIKKLRDHYQNSNAI